MSLTELRGTEQENWWNNNNIWMLEEEELTDSNTEIEVVGCTVQRGLLALVLKRLDLWFQTSAELKR
jgi:hypothetical protein